MNLIEFRKNPAVQRPHYLLIGHPVAHSLSPLMHNTALQHYKMSASYHAIDLLSSELNDLAVILNRETFMGANITIPYKQTIIDYLDSLDPSAEKIGAVNTIVQQNNGLVGYNTDHDGFLSPLKKYKDKIAGGRAVVFGTGGASKSIVRALSEFGIEMIYLVSRTPERISWINEVNQVKVISYHQWTSFAEESQLIVNATPLGMHPNVDKSPVRNSEKEWLADHICYDIVYNPLKTKFLRQAEDAGATTIGGLEMLIEQGSRSFALWTGQTFPMEKVKNKLYEKIGD